MKYSDLFVEKYRPKSLDEMVIDPGIKKYFEDIFSSEDPVIPNLLFRGRPGGGKTTLAKIIQNRLGWETLVINASEENGVDTMRDKVVSFCQTVSINGGMKLVILEEADGLSSSSMGGKGSSAQELLKNLIETSSKYVRFILLVNNVSKIDEPIKSRMQEFEIVPPSIDTDGQLIRYIVKIIKNEGIQISSAEDIKKLVKTYYPDIRKILQVLQQCSYNDEHEFRFENVSDGCINEIIDDILKMLARRKDVTDEELRAIREKYIYHEQDFSSDYLILMRSLFETVVSKEPTSQHGFVFKLECLRKIQDYMYRHAFVADKEINFFALIISLIRL